MNCKLDVLQGILILAKEDPTREQVNKLLLATDNEGRNVIDVAARHCELQVIQGTLNWVK
jgi:hypothetical protein